MHILPESISNDTNLVIFLQQANFANMHMLLNPSTKNIVFKQYLIANPCKLCENASNIFIKHPPLKLNLPNVTNAINATNSTSIKSVKKRSVESMNIGYQADNIITTTNAKKESDHTNDISLPTFKKQKIENPIIKNNIIIVKLVNQMNGKRILFPASGSLEDLIKKCTR